jgi:hypothetical protein
MGNERKVYRFTGSESPDTGAGFTMWADNVSEIESGYGKYGWQMDTGDLPDIETFRNEITKAWDNDLESGNLPSDLVDMGRGILDGINPRRIVNSAESWDSPEFVRWFWDRIGEPNELIGVKTEDGAIIFDHSNAKRYRSGVESETEYRWRTADSPKPADAPKPENIAEAMAVHPDEDEFIHALDKAGVLDEHESSGLRLADKEVEAAEKYETGLFTAITCI